MSPKSLLVSHRSVNDGGEGVLRLLWEALVPHILVDRAVHDKYLLPRKLSSWLLKRGCASVNEYDDHLVEYVVSHYSQLHCVQALIIRTEAPLCE